MVLIRSEEPSAARRPFRVGEQHPDRPQPLALPRERVEDDYRPAAAVHLGDDDRNRHVVFSEIVADLRSTRSDLARCVQLATAKLAYEDVHPETRQGAAPGAAGGGKQARPKDPDAGSFVARASAGTGWGRTTIYRWVAIGSGICASAYELALGTRLANRIGLLELLAQLTPDRQVDVARDYNSSLARQAAKKLQRYTEERERAAAPAASSGDTADDGEKESTPGGTNPPPSVPEPPAPRPTPVDDPAAVGASSILAALGASTEAEALSCVARLRGENEAMRAETTRLRGEIARLEGERDSLVDGSAIYAVFRELGAADAKAALEALKELKSHAAA